MEYLYTHEQLMALIQVSKAEAWDEGFAAGQGSMLKAAGGTAKTNPYRKGTKNNG